MLIEAIKTDYQSADIDLPTRALLDMCVKLPLTPAAMTETDIEELRGHGFTDEAIHDTVQVTAYFNYINRVCDGLGVDLEEWMDQGKTKT